MVFSVPQKPIFTFYSQLIVQESAHGSLCEAPPWFLHLVISAVLCAPRILEPCLYSGLFHTQLWWFVSSLVYLVPVSVFSVQLSAWLAVGAHLALCKRQINIKHVFYPPPPTNKVL